MTLVAEYFPRMLQAINTGVLWDQRVSVKREERERPPILRKDRKSREGRETRPSIEPPKRASYTRTFSSNYRFAAFESNTFNDEL